MLADGVAYAAKDLSCDIVLDMATLTGAQGISTGKYHACHLSNSQSWETAVSAAGRISGDLSFPGVSSFKYSHDHDHVSPGLLSRAPVPRVQLQCCGHEEQCGGP